MESRESYVSSESNLYSKVSSLGSKIGRLAVTGLVGVFSYLPAYAIQNTLPDADRDGAGDSYETANGSNPNVYDSKFLEIPDGLQLGGPSPDAFPGATTTFYDPDPDKNGLKDGTFVPDLVNHTDGMHEIPVGHNISGTKEYFLRGKAIDGVNAGTKYIGDADLYSVDVGTPASETALTSGATFSRWGLDFGSGNLTNTGIYFSDDGVIKEFFDNSKIDPRVILESKTGETYYNPVYYTHSTLGPHLLVNVVPSDRNGLASVINAYPLKDGVADSKNFDKVVDMTQAGLGPAAGGVFYSRPSPNGKLAWLLYSEEQPLAPMILVLSTNADLEAKISDNSSTGFYRNSNNTEWSYKGSSKGLFPLGWSGENLLSLYDEEEAFTTSGAFETNLLEGTTDFDLRVWSTNSSSIRTFVLWPGNQFAVDLLPDKRMAVTNFNGGTSGTDGKIDYAVLESAVYIGPGGAKSISQPLNFDTDAGLQHSIPPGTTITLPLGTSYIHERANFNIINPPVDPSALVTRQIDSTPSGTTFDTSTHLVKFPISKDLLTYLGKEITDPTVVDVKLDGVSLAILSRDSSNSTVSAYVDHFSDSTVIINGVNSLPGDTDGDGLSDTDETDVYFTNPLVFDTDNDGLSDGQEELQYNTNPNNFDTDGDGVGDGTEVSLGTDPLNPNDFPTIPINRCGQFGLVSLLGMVGGSYLIKKRYGSKSSTSNR